MPFRNLFLIILTSLFLSGCGLVYTNIRTPFGYNTATPSDVKASSQDETVIGEACNQSVLHLVAWGRGGYDSAVKNALGSRADAVLYDVRTDFRVQIYAFGLYTRTCTIVTGRIGTP